MASTSFIPSSTSMSRAERLAKRTEKRDADYEKNMKKKRIDERSEETLAWANDLTDNEQNNEQNNEQGQDDDRNARRTRKVLERRNKLRILHIQKTLDQKYLEKIENEILPFMTSNMNKAYEKVHEANKFYADNGLIKMTPYSTLHSFYFSIFQIRSQIIDTKEMIRFVVYDIEDDEDMSTEEKCDMCTFVETLYQHAQKLLCRGEKRMERLPDIFAKAMVV